MGGAGGSLDMEAFQRITFVHYEQGASCCARCARACHMAMQLEIMRNPLTSTALGRSSGFSETHACRTHASRHGSAESPLPGIWHEAGQQSEHQSQPMSGGAAGTAGAAGNPCFVNG